MKVLLTCLVMSIFFAASYGQQLPITVYTPRNGALFSGANSVFQDHQGWMWFTNSYDVVRYDGNTFHTYPPVASAEMNFCYGILEVQNEIWVLANPQIMKVTGDSLTPLRVDGFFPDISSHIGVAGKDYILGDHGLYQYLNRKFETIIADTSLNFHNDEKVFLWNDSILISFQWRKNLLAFNLNSKKPYSASIPVISICRQSEGRLYILVKDKGIFELTSVSIASGKLIPGLQPVFDPKDTKAEQFDVDTDGNFWIGIQDKYLVKWHPDHSLHRYDEADGLPSLWFYRIFRDREGNLWIAMNNGLCKISHTSWKRYTKDQGLYSNHTLFITKGLSDESILVGTYDGVNLVSENEIRSWRQNGQHFICQYMIHNGLTVFYSRDSILYSARLDTSTYSVIDEKLLTRLSGKAMQLAADRNGSIFIATDHGLQIWTHIQLHTPFNETSHVYTLHIDVKERLWLGEFIGNLKGYNIIYKNGSPVLIPILPTTSISEIYNNMHQIRAITSDMSGHIFAGTRYNGLFSIQMTDDKISAIRHWSEKDNLNSNSIWGLSADIKGNCLAATARGINLIDPVSATITDAGLKAGIYQAAAVFVSANQNIWIGSHPGIVLLEKEKEDTSVYSVFITDISVNGKRIIPIREQSYISAFSHDHNNVMIEFSSNTFVHEQDMRYSYRLRINDRGDWSPLRHTQSINYPALPPGKYQFQVKAVNNNGVLSQYDAAYDFQILPPFWQKAWFFWMTILISAVLIYALYRYRIQQLMKLQLMRNNISRNLHDDIGASLSNIHILNTLTHRHLQDHLKAESYLQQASEDIQRISESLSDIVWNVNPLNDDLDHLYSHMKRYAADMLEGKNIAAKLIFPVHGRKIHLSMEKRRDFFLIFKEAIHNLIKYSRASEASVELREGNNIISMVIQDNGVGFDMHQPTSGNGLINMHHRAEAQHADLKITSLPGNGTLVELHMKIH